MSGLINIASYILVVGVLVFVHEFGHYAVAKLCGVRVDVFSLGFGKRILGFKRGDTDYRLSLLPLGGYVKMAGENPLEGRTGDAGEFTSHPRWQRFLIAIAGPSMNVLLAFVVFVGIYMFHYEHPKYLHQPANVGTVLPGSPAEKAGVKPGDRIARILDVDNPTWEQVTLKVVLNPDQPLNLVLQRGDQFVPAKIVPQAAGPNRGGDAGWLPPHEPAIVDLVEPETPAARAGLQPGDRILAANGIPMATTPEFSQYLQQVQGAPLQLSVRRNGKELNFTVTPEFRSDDKRFRIGFRSASLMQVDKLPMRAAISRAYDACKTYSGAIFEVVGKLIRNKISLKQLDGPIQMAAYSGEAAREKGWSPLLMLLAIISLNLAVFNLLPIPILDGGLMLMLMIEGIMRRDIKQQVKERVYQAAFVFLVLFVAVVLFNDVAKNLPHG